MLNSIFDELPNTPRPDTANRQAVLLQQIDSIRHKMKLAQDLFDLSDNEALTDACIYQMKALGCYYRYLMEEARQNGCRRQPESRTAPAPLRAAGIL